VSNPLIVGYDPGTTAALAILDTRGGLLFLESKRTFKKSEIIDEITKRGKPIIIAGDRSPLPKKLEKLASTLGCKTYHPYESLPVSEKVDLVKEYDEKIKDEHERDALASAIRAYKYYKKLFKKVEISLSSLGLNTLYDQVIQLLVFGKVDNINDAINRVLTKSREKRKPEKIKIEKKVFSEDTVKKLQDRIKGLEKDISILKKYNEGLREKITKSKEKAFNYRKELNKKIEIGTISSLKNDIKKLKIILREKESLIEELKSYRKLELGGYVPLIRIDEIRSVSISDLQKRINLEGRLLHSKNPENAQILNECKIKALIISDEPTEALLQKVKFPVISEKDISSKKVNNIIVVEKEELEEKIRNARKIGFKKWLEGHRIRKL